MVPLPGGGSRTWTGPLALLLLSGCAPVNVHPAGEGASGPSPARSGYAGSGGGPDAWGLVTPEAGADLPAPAVAQTIVVYAHSSDRLFRVDPDSLNVIEIGRFHRRGTTPPVPVGGVTDLAVDRAGRVFGLTTGELLQVDAFTAGCDVITALPQGRNFNGMSWVRGEGTSEQLVATGFDGSVFRIDPQTGASSLLGALGDDLRSSGDLVSVALHGTLATATGPGTDQLVRIDPATGRATRIGPVGFTKVWGLGFWQDRVFGFTDQGQFISINPTTGAGTLVRSLPNLHFWGAGVTTSAPVIQ